MPLGRRTREIHLLTILRFLSVVALSAVASSAFAQGDVNVICTVPIPWCEAIAATFLKETGITVNVTIKNTNDALATLAAEKSDPKHDVWYAGNGGAHVQAGYAGLTEEYRSSMLPQLHDWAVRQAERSRGHAVGIHAAALGIGYNSRALAHKRLPEPRCWADLAKPEYRDEVEMSTPMTSEPGYAALATLVQVFGEEKAFELLNGVHRNVKNYSRTGTGAIRAVARSETTVAVAWLHDAVTEIANGFPVVLVMPCEGTGYQVDAMSIVSGAPHRDHARRFYDWALTPAAQRIGGDTKNFQMPSNRETPVPAAAPDWETLKLIPFDFARFGNAAERKRLLEKWDREVQGLPR